MQYIKIFSAWKNNDFLRNKCVDRCIYINIYIYIYTHTHIYKWMNIGIHTHTHIYNWVIWLHIWNKQNITLNKSSILPWVWSVGWEDPLEKGMATHSSILPWRIPWTEEPGGLQSLGLQRIRHDLATNSFTCYPSTKNWKLEPGLKDVFKSCSRMACWT